MDGRASSFSPLFFGVALAFFGAPPVPDPARFLPSCGCRGCTSAYVGISSTDVLGYRLDRWMDGCAGLLSVYLSVCLSGWMDGKDSPWELVRRRCRKWKCTQVVRPCYARTSWTPQLGPWLWMELIWAAWMGGWVMDGAFGTRWERGREEGLRFRQNITGPNGPSPLNPQQILINKTKRHHPLPTLPPNPHPTQNQTPTRLQVPHTDT